jgi:hypothetical protein
VDLDMFGHQWVLHHDPHLEVATRCHNLVDGKKVPVPHFGVILTMAQWQELSERLKQLNINFVIEPYVRFKGQPGEQATLFILDPSGNALEFKAFQDFSQIFAV